MKQVILNQNGFYTKPVGIRFAYYCNSMRKEVKSIQYDSDMQNGAQFEIIEPISGDTPRMDFIEKGG